ncbi:MAG: hypothetical protein J3R72DRAFT_230870 [Linnemannia gamsii]|nr:MAG: hypothetical protein J3R72DRAFT_230870 [Linnemannia gamsii]
MDETQSFRISGTTDIKNIGVDIVNGQNVIYWEDIEQVFPKVGYICNGSSVVKLIRDSNRTRIVPHRIKHYPGVVLDVILATGANLLHEESPMVTSTLTPIHTPIDPYRPGTTIDELNVSPPASSTLTMAKPASGLVITADPLADLLSAEPHQASVTNITSHYTGPSASVTIEKAPFSRDLTHENIEKWAKTATETENVSIFGSGYAPTIWSEVASTTARAFKPLIVPTESESGSLWSERVQDTRWEGRLSIEAADVQDIQYEHRIRNNSSVSLQEVHLARTSSTSELANIMTRAEKEEDHDEEDIEAMSDQGYVDHWIKLGYAHQHGLVGISQDFSEAIKWYQMAADRGSAQAQSNIGSMYEEGHGVTQDFSKAVMWYRKAAAQEYAAAQCNLGGMYMVGTGVTQDYAKAAYWIRKSAVQGEKAAQCRLAMMYQLGIGVTKNYAKALEWCQKSAIQGDVDAQYNLGLMFLNGEGTSKDLTKALEWWSKAASQGHTEAKRLHKEHTTTCSIL